MGPLERDLAEHDIIGVDTIAVHLPLGAAPPLPALVRDAVSPSQGATRPRHHLHHHLIEACVLPQRQGRQDLVQVYERALLHSQQVQALAIDAILARRATALRAKYNVRVPDALQIAAALEAGATALVTNDRRLEKVQDLKVLVLDDYLA